MQSIFTAGAKLRLIKLHGFVTSKTERSDARLSRNTRNQTRNIAHKKTIAKPKRSEWRPAPGKRLHRKEEPLQIILHSKKRCFCRTIKIGLLANTQTIEQQSHRKTKEISPKTNTTKDQTEYARLDVRKLNINIYNNEPLSQSFGYQYCALPKRYLLKFIEPNVKDNDLLKRDGSI